MIKRWKAKINITILNQFTITIIIKANNIDLAKIRIYEKTKKKYPNATDITIVSIKEV